MPSSIPSCNLSNSSSIKSKRCGLILSRTFCKKSSKNSKGFSCLKIFERARVNWVWKGRSESKASAPGRPEKQYSPFDVHSSPGPYRSFVNNPCRHSNTGQRRAAVNQFSSTRRPGRQSRRRQSRRSPSLCPARRGISSRPFLPTPLTISSRTKSHRRLRVREELRVRGF